MPDDNLESLLQEMRPRIKDEPLHPHVDDLTKRRVMASVLTEYNSRISKQNNGIEYRKMGIVAAMAAVTVAAILLGAYNLTGSSKDVEKDSLTASNLGSSDALVPKSWFSLLHGNVHCGDTAVQLGSKIPLKKWIETDKGQSAFALPTGIAVGLADNSAARVFWNGSRRYEVEINQGMALFSVNPSKSREGFFVRTPKGLIEVTGTLFTVIVNDNGNVSVHLHRGKIEIHGNDHHPTHVEEGHTATLGSKTVDVAKSTDNAQVAQQLHKMGCIDGGKIFSELADTNCDLDTGSSIQTSTASASSAETTSHPNTQSLAKNFTKPTIEELLTAEKRARRAKNWADVATIYQSLIRFYPRSHESRTALVTLGQIEIRKLNRPKSALRHFNAYLKSPGALEQEALYGKSKAFQMTQNPGNEIRTLKKLISKYPTGPISQAANKRLGKLSPNQK